MSQATLVSQTTQQLQYQVSQAQQHSSTLDPHRSGLVEEKVNKQATASQHQRQEDPRTLDPYRGLIGVRSHPNINTLWQLNINQDRRSILISVDETTQRPEPTDDISYKKNSVFERLGSSTNLPRSNTVTNRDSRNNQQEINRRDIKHQNIEIP